MNRDELLAIAQEPHVAAFLHVIRFCEGTLGERGYQTIFGYRYFDDFADHPRVRVPFGTSYTTAAGAFQFIEGTWDSMAVKYALPDFSPASQIAAAVGLLIRRGALDAIRAGDLPTALELTNKEWASLPGSPYGQPTRTMVEVRRAWDNALAAAAPIDNRGTPAQPQEQPMVAPVAVALGVPLVNALIQQLITKLPELTRIFTDKTTPVNERNVQAGIKVLEAVQQATGSSGPASAVERVVTDPSMVAPAREAVAPLIELVEVGGGIHAAREQLTRMSSMGGWPAIGYGALVGGVAVAVIVGGGAFMGWLTLQQDADKQITAQIVDYFKAAGFIVLGFLYGTSRSSQRKDDVLITKMAER